MTGTIECSWFVLKTEKDKKKYMSAICRKLFSSGQISEKFVHGQDNLNYSSLGHNYSSRMRFLKRPSIKKLSLRRRWMGITAMMRMLPRQNKMLSFSTVWSPQNTNTSEVCATEFHPLKKTLSVCTIRKWKQKVFFWAGEILLRTPHSCSYFGGLSKNSSFFFCLGNTPV